MGRYLRAMARACQPPGASRQGDGLLAAPLSCQDREAATVGPYSGATPRALRCDGDGWQGWGYSPLPCPTLTPKPRPGGAYFPPGMAGLSQGGEGLARGIGPEVVTLIARGRHTDSAPSAD